MNLVVFGLLTVFGAFDTPYCGLNLVERGVQDFPHGVLQVLSCGHDLGLLCTAHAGIYEISFTGSIATGKLVMQSCSKI